MNILVLTHFDREIILEYNSMKIRTNMRCKKDLNNRHKDVNKVFALKLKEFCGKKVKLIACKNTVSRKPARTLREMACTEPNILGRHPFNFHFFL